MSVVKMNTEQIAILGAITGVIGCISGIINLIFRYKQFKKDERKLESFLEIDVSYSDSLKTNFSLVVISLGKREVILDKYITYYQPTEWLEKLFPYKAWKKQLFTSITDFSNTRLKDGERHVAKIHTIGLDSYSKIRKIRIIDKTGKSWKVKIPSFKEVENKHNFKILDEFEKSNDLREVKLKSYELNGVFYINIMYCFSERITNTRTKNRSYRFSNFKKYEARANEIINETIPDFLNEKIDVL